MKKNILLIIIITILQTFTSFSQTHVYELGASNVSSEYSCGVIKYGYPGNILQLTWTSTGTAVPVSISVSLNYGVNCYATSYNDRVAFNGSYQGSQPTPGPYGCSCNPSPAPTTWNLNPSDYVVGGVNVLNVESINDAEGISLLPGYPDAYARVTVRYAISPGPEINIKNGTESIVRGDITPATGDGTEYGTLAAGTSLDRTFTIENEGTSNLTLTGSPIVTVSGSSAFSIQTQPGSNTIAASASQTFVVRFNPTCAQSGLQTAVVSIASDDANETPYTFTVQGSGAADNVKPVAIAKNITVQLDATGSVTVNAADLNDGSTDNCSISSYKIGSGHAGTVCDMVNEGNDLVLTAPSGVFTNVDFASYGTPSGSCGNYTLGFCNYFNSKSYVETFLLGKSTATIAANNTTFFPDPCGGTPKRLAVQATYGPVTGSEASSITYSCADVGTKDVTFYVTDSNGNVSTVNVIITVQDNEIPVIVSSGDQNVNVDAGICGANITVSATATDNCTVDTPTGVRSDAQLLTDVYPVGITTITWNVSDAAGNAATAVTQTITVTDNEIPVIASNGDQNVNVDAGTCGANVTVSATATDNCTVGTPAGVRSDAQLLTDVYPVGITTIAWNVKDSNGNDAVEVIQTITVTDNEVPVIASNGDQNVNVDAGTCSANETVSATATDNCTVGTPTGVRSDAQLLTDVYPVGITTITWNVSDANGNAAVAVIQTVTVTDNEVPVIASNGDQNVNTDSGTCGANVTVSSSATDNCTVGTPTGVRSDAQLLTDVYPVGTTTITWNVSDANGNAAIAVIQTVTVTDNKVPVIASNGDQNVNVDTGICGAVVLVSATATDNCTVGTPAGVRSDAKLLSDVYPLGTTTIAWNVSDANGNAATTVTQTITVTDNEVPVIASNGDQNVNTDTGICEATVTVSASATDNCTVGIPTGVRSDAKLLSDVYPVGTTTITWNVSDANGNAAVAVIQTVTVTDNEVPVIASNGDQNVNTDAGICGANVTVSATATDNCTVGTPTGVRSDAQLLTDVYPLGTTTITWNVSDANGNAAVAVIQTVTVADNEIPVIASNGDKTVNADAGICGAAVLVSATATDNCTVGTPIGVRSDAQLLTAVYPLGITTITWNVSDANGNAAVALIQTVTITDNEIPVIASNGDQNVNTDAGICGALVLVSATATDNCAVGTPSGVRSDAKLLSDTYPVGTTIITWNVKDVNGNDAVEVTQTIKVTDNALPLVITKNRVVQLNSSGTATIQASDIDDNSSDNCSIVSLTVSPNSFTCANIGLNTVTLTATDANGNVTSQTATVTVENKNLPVVATKNITVPLDATGKASIIADNVDNGSTVVCGTPTLVVSPTTFTCVNVGPNTVTLTVTDANGNTFSKTAIVTIEDKIAATVLTKNLTVQLDATGNAAITASQIDNGSSDSCGVASIAVSPNTFNCNNVGANTVTLTVTDVNGNKSTGTAIVTVQDNILPTVKTQDLTVELDDAGNASIIASQINNGSSDNCGIATVSLDKLSFSCTNVGINTVVLTVIDKNGNTATATAKVTVVNTFGDNDSDGILDNCDNDDDNDGVLDAFDNCPTTANPYQEDRNNNGLGDACDAEQMNISQAFTPNGDGINDTWVISNIELHTNSVVRVFNRWGTEVFFARNYQNDWDGQSKGSSGTLPAASSYFYQIDLDGNGSIDKEGWIYINK